MTKVIFDPIFGEDVKQEVVAGIIDTPVNVITASEHRNYVPPKSPISHQPMTRQYVIVDGHRIDCYADLKNRVVYPANKDDVF